MISSLRALELRNEVLTAAHAIDIGGIDEIDAAIHRLVKAASESESLTVPQVPPMAQTPKLISETFQPVGR